MPRGRPRKTDDVLMRSAELIGWALGGLEREITATKERLAMLTAQASTLRARLPPGFAGASGVTATADEGTAPNRKRRRRRMSREARKRISEMMKKRWAERRKRQS